MTFGEHLRALRACSGLSAHEIAEGAGITANYLWKLERGQEKAPPEDTVIRLAKVLQADPEVLVVMAGILPGEALEIIKRHPRQFLDLIGALRDAEHSELDQLTKAVRDGDW